MVRPLRKLVPDGWYHVFGRGWDRRHIFSDDHDRHHFLELLEGLTESFRFRIHAFVLMDNHWHGIFQTPDANLSQGMQWFNTSYSAWFNARHGRVGSLWQGRYRDVLIEDSAWAYELSIYVHLNPLRLARLGLDKRGRMMEGTGYREPTREQSTERLQRLRNYHWSSYRAYAGYCAPQPWLSTQALWTRAHAQPSQQRGSYRTELKARLTHGVDPDRAERLRDVIGIGGAAFARRVRESVDPESEITHRRELRKRVSEKRVRDAVVAVRGESWQTFCESRGDWGRLIYLWAMHRYTGCTLREAGQHAGSMKPSTVSMAIKRWHELVTNDPDMSERQEELIRQLEALIEY
jgi:putative transposase